MTIFQDSILVVMLGLRRCKKQQALNMLCRFDV